MPIDLWPTFWMRVADLIRNGQVFSSIKVKEEIERGNDELTEWMRNNAPRSFYYPLDSDVLKMYANAQEWVASNSIFLPVARNDFATVADAYLIATAAAKHLTLVTYEKSNLQSRKRVMIPNVCDALNVRYCDLNTVFRELGITI